MTQTDWRFSAIGTQWAITGDEPVTDAVRERILGAIDDYDRVYSRFRADSVVSVLAREGGSAELPEHAVGLFELYERLYELTGGAMTPLVGASLERLGYDAAYTLEPHGAPLPAPPLGRTLRRNGRRIALAAPASIDVGAAGKGQLVDLVSELLIAAGVTDATVDAGGDLRVNGSQALRVALEHPADPSLAVGVVILSGRRRAIAGSAVNRRAWGDGLHHVLDGTTGMPVQDVVASWALAPTAMQADAAATALFFLPGPVVERELDVDWVTVLPDGRLECSAAVREGMFLE
ncbi:MAG TPA: FAD:protein FMN transferase [Gryllotalpicola sp.]